MNDLQRKLTVTEKAASSILHRKFCKIKQLWFCKLEKCSKKIQSLIILPIFIAFNELVNLFSGNPEHYSGRLLCTENGNSDWDSERSYSSLPAICAARCRVASH